MADAQSTPDMRDVPGFPFYRVSADGKVWGCRARYTRKISDWRPLSPHPDRKGYLVVSLRRDGRLRNHLVHRLVLQTFVGPRPAGTQCRHLDGDQTNNALSNLCWGTPLENAADARRHGTQPRGERVGSAKLTVDQVREIRRLHAEEGYGLKRLRRIFGVHRTNIRAILRRTAWAHV